MAQNKRQDFEAKEQASTPKMALSNLMLTEDEEALREFYKEFNNWCSGQGISIYNLPSHREYYLIREFEKALIAKLASQAADSFRNLIENHIREFHYDMSKAGNKPTLSESSRAREIMAVTEAQKAQAVEEASKESWLSAIKAVEAEYPELKSYFGGKLQSLKEK